MEIVDTSTNCYLIPDFSQNPLYFLDNWVKWEQIVLDPIIIALYFYKIQQFKRKRRNSRISSVTTPTPNSNSTFSDVNQDPDEDAIARRVTSILKKIVILTLCYEVYHFIRLFPDHELGYDEPWKLWVHFAIQSFENIGVSIVAFLMIDHNDEYYRIFVCRNCCNQRLETKEEMEFDPDNIDMSRQQNISMDTTMIQLEEIPMTHSVIGQSELTSIVQVTEID